MRISIIQTDPPETRVLAVADKAADHSFDGLTDIALQAKPTATCSSPATQCYGPASFYNGPTTCCDPSTSCVQLNYYCMF